MSITAKIQALRTTQQKAISHHPELAGRVHLSSQYADSVSVSMEDFADYARVYGTYAWVRKAIGKIADAIAPLPVRVVGGDGQEVKSHVLNNLLAYVNDSMSPADLWQSWVVHMLLAGESFLELVDDNRGMPAELWPRRADRILVVPDAAPDRILYPTVLEYVYETSGQQPTHIERRAMIHSKFYNPLSPWRGLAPIAALRESITIDLFSQAWSKLFLKRGARPDFAVVAPLGMTHTEKEEIVDSLMASHSGVEGWHRPIVLEQGIQDIKPFSWAPKDIEWLQQREFSRDEVGAVFGVPDEIMGYGRDTYENFQTAMEVFWTLTLRPLLSHRDVSFTHHFTKVWPLLEPGQKIETDVSEIGALQEDMTPKLEQASRLWSLGIPFNVIDERLGLDIGPVPGGDVGYIPFNLMPLSGGDGKQQPASQAGAVRVVRAMTLDYGSPRHVAMWKSFEAQRRPYELRIVHQLKRDLQAQQVRALRNVRGVFGEKAARAIKQQVVLDAAEVLDWDDEVRQFVEEYLALFESVVDGFGSTQLGSLGVNIPFDVRNPLIQDAIREMSIRFAKDINQTTQERIAGELREILIEAENEGLNVPQVQERIYDRISQVYNVRKSDYETERIARTEVTKASNAGQLEGMRQSGVVQHKGWLAALDSRVRDTHIQAHQRYNEEGIPIDALFEVGRDQMLHPGGGHVLEENINCRCVAIPIL